MTDTPKSFREKLAEAIIILIIGLFAIVVATYLINLTDKLSGDNKEKLNDISQNIENLQKNIAPYDYKDKLKKIEIVSDFTNSSIDNVQTATFEENLLVNGSISEGFLYIKANVDRKALTGYDGIYVKLNGKINNQYQELGGHLITSKSLSTPTSNVQTELLFPLSDIKYKKTFLKNDLEFFSGDWLDMLNNGTNRNILGFVSTSRKGTIVEMSIYYNCADRSDCSIALTQ